MAFVSFCAFGADLGIRSTADSCLVAVRWRPSGPSFQLSFNTQYCIILSGWQVAKDGLKVIDGGWKAVENLHMPEARDGINHIVLALAITRLAWFPCMLVVSVGCLVGAQCHLLDLLEMIREGSGVWSFAAFVGGKSARAFRCRISLGIGPPARRHVSWSSFLSLHAQDHLSCLRWGQVSRTSKGGGWRNFWMRNLKLSPAS
jgi:hypothetical protein